MEMTTIREIHGSTANWRPVKISEGLRDCRPKTLGKTSIDFFITLDPVPELGIIFVPNGSVFGSHGWVFTADNRFISEISWWHGPRAQLWRPPALPNPTHISGRCLVLASDWGNVNYCHFILDCLTRFHLFQLAGYTLDDVDYICIPSPPSRSAYRTMISLGIQVDKCIWSDDNTLLKADELIATSFPGSRGTYAQWIPGYLQTTLQPITPAHKAVRKIYISRKGNREIVNEEEILEIVHKYDIEVIKDLIEEDKQPELFHDCQLVIGSHGAALTNIAFCRPNTKVLELIPSDQQLPYYFTLAAAGQLDYYCLRGDSLGERPRGSFGPSPFDFRVEPYEFEASLQLILAWIENEALRAEAAHLQSVVAQEIATRDNLTRERDAAIAVMNQSISERDALAAESTRWFDAVNAVTADDPLARASRLRRNFARHLNYRRPLPVALANRARDAGRWELAVRYYRDALDVEPDDPEIWMQCGLALEKAGKTSEAERAFQRSRDVLRRLGGLK